MCFESRVLVKITESMGLHRNYFLEQKLMLARADQTLPFYDYEEHLDQEFFRKKDSESVDKQPRTKMFVSALEFLNKNIKKDASINSSDFIVCFLEAFNVMFPG